MSTQGIQSESKPTFPFERALANLENVTVASEAAERVAASAACYRQLFSNGSNALAWMVDDQELIAKIDNEDHAVGQLLPAEEALVAIKCASRLNEASSGEQLINWVRKLREQAVTAIEDPLDLVDQQLNWVELPLTMACLLNSVIDTSAIVEAATEAMQKLLDKVLDTDGWPANDVVSDFGMLCASWCRSSRLIDSIGQRNLDDSLNATLSGLPRQLMRLLRGDGTLMMGASHKRLPDEMLSAILQHSNDLTDQLILERTGKRPVTPRPNRVALDESRNSVSEWGGNFLFHDGWERKSCKLAAMFDAAGFSIEIGKKGTLVNGACFPKVSLSGQPMAIEGEPELLVSQCDEDVAFAEIQWAMTGGAKLQRHVLLSMENKFAWIGDVILPPDGQLLDRANHEFEYSCRWPLAKGMSTIAESETNEGYVCDGREIRALVIPPALKEWKTERPTGTVRAGKLDLENTGFTLTQSGIGRAMYVPLFLDLSPRRSKRPRTWRQLTVAEKLEIVPSDVAVAYRVQVGKKQFVFYRALGEAQNRTFFGQNVNTELFVGRLEKDRSMTELLQVE